ncbi:MAG: PEGA domain-containing protein [Spirochaetes bacterium]|nr:PEGA domain-containing protein [Spirochaetota bacterium]
MKRKILAVFLVLAAVNGLLLAQAKTSLTIRCDQAGAQVYIEDKLAGSTQPTFSIFLLPGTYKIRVSKEGFSEFQTTAVVGMSPVTLQVTLGKAGNPNPQPSPPPKAPVAKYQLSVDANQRGAQVFVNGTYVGNTPLSVFLEQGSYSVDVKLEGFEDSSKNIRMNGAYRHYAVLDPRPLSVYIDANNAPGASIYRDSSFVGTTPYRGAWMPGSYDVRISSPGFSDFRDQFTVHGPITLSVALMPALVEYEIRIPELFAMKADKPTRFEDLLILIDGAQLTSPFGTMLPGTHHLELYFGDLHLKTNFDVPKGGRFVLEPFLGVNVY